MERKHEQICQRMQAKTMQSTVSKKRTTLLLNRAPVITYSPKKHSKQKDWVVKRERAF